MLVQCEQKSILDNFSKLKLFLQGVLSNLHSSVFFSGSFRPKKKSQNFDSSAVTNKGRGNRREKNFQNNLCFYNLRKKVIHCTGKPKNILIWG